MIRGHNKEQIERNVVRGIGDSAVVVAKFERALEFGCY